MHALISPWRQRLGVAACALALVAAGCGSDGDGADTGGDGARQGIRSEVRAELRSVLTDDQALTDSEADCALRRLEDELDAGALELDAAGELPRDTVQTAFEAGVACAGR